MSLRLRCLSFQIFTGFDSWLAFKLSWFVPHGEDDDDDNKDDNADNAENNHILDSQLTFPGVMG